MNYKDFLKKGDEILFWVMLLFGIALAMMFNTSSKEFAITVLFPILLVIFGVFIILGVIGFVLDIREKDFDYFKRVISGIVGGFVVFLLTKINFSSLKEIWSSLVSSFQLIIIALITILIGYFIQKTKNNSNIIR